MIVTGKDFRANPSRYIGIAHSGGNVILKSRAGSVRLIPVDTGDAKIGSVPDFNQGGGDFLSGTEAVTFSGRERQIMEDAHNMTLADVEYISQKEEMSIEESQMLLLRMVEDEYQRP